MNFMSETGVLRGEVLKRLDAYSYMHVRYESAVIGVRWGHDDARLAKMLRAPNAGGMPEFSLVSISPFGC